MQFYDQTIRIAECGPCTEWSDGDDVWWDFCTETFHFRINAARNWDTACIWIACTNKWRCISRAIPQFGCVLLPDMCIRLNIPNEFVFLFGNIDTRAERLNE